MDLPDGQQALEDIQALEHRLDERANKARAKAKEMLDAAIAQAAAIVSETEGRLDALRRSATAPATGAAQRNGAEGFVPDEKAVDELAGDLFEKIKRT